MSELVGTRYYLTERVGQLILHPQMFSLGSPGRPYKNCTTTVLPGYVPDLDAATSLGDFPEFLLPNAWDTKRAKGKDYEYLMRPRKPGAVHVATRGKGLAIAVGHVSLMLYAVHN